MTTITSNKYQLIGKTILQLIVLGVVFLFISVPIRFGFSYNSKGIMPLVFSFFFIIFFIFNFFQLFYTPIGVTIDENQKTISIEFLFRGSQIVQIDEIENYATTKVSTKSTLYEGILVKLKNKKSILLTDYNLKTFKPILTFLEQYNIQSIGHEIFKPIKYYKNCI
ncbi:MAG: hypothetical protein JHC39_00830 [Lentimicrobium sp.]|jgi:hypothetical protein|nr:hypothetical protein [Lentimicrobium sp.]